jgi:hypothetical protein
MDLSIIQGRRLGTSGRPDFLPLLFALQMVNMPLYNILEERLKHIFSIARIRCECMSLMPETVHTFELNLFLYYILWNVIMSFPVIFHNYCLYILTCLEVKIKIRYSEGCYRYASPVIPEASTWLDWSSCSSFDLKMTPVETNPPYATLVLRLHILNAWVHDWHMVSNSESIARRQLSSEGHVTLNKGQSLCINERL